MRVAIGDIRLFVDVDGAQLVPNGPEMREKPVMVLIHGGPGSDHSHFKPHFDQLSRDLQLIYFDQRGSGRSDVSTRELWMLDQWAEDTKSLCDALGIERPIVLGASFGGFIAQAYAIRFPDHPSKLILCSTAAQLRFDRISSMFEQLGGQVARKAADDFWQGENVLSAIPAYLKTCVPHYTRHGTLSLDAFSRAKRNDDALQHFLGSSGEGRHFNFLPHLRGIRCPTLILAGENDPVTTLADAEDLAAAIPEKYRHLRRIPDCGHETYLDSPTLTFRAIRDFLGI